jgi:two-component system sensor histidine kinase SenX3
LARQDGRVAIRVCDRGIGIPRDEQKRIFRKFVRGTASKVNGIKGTGVGLALVEHIVSAHGGTIDLQSQPGVGSTFTLLLPAT